MDEYVNFWFKFYIKHWLVYECTFLRLFNVYVCSTGQYLVSGSHDGSVLVWDTNSTPIEDTTLSDPVIQPKLRFQAQFDTVNGVRYYNFLFLTLYFCRFCLLIRFSSPPPWPMTSLHPRFLSFTLLSYKAKIKNK